MSENKMLSNKIADDLEPVSMYQMFARMFVHLAKEVVDEFGEKGSEAIKRGVWNFGVERGEGIAKRAFARGKNNDSDNYLISYDMDRSDEFESIDTYHKGYVEQVFSRCVFASEFQKMGMEKYGILYCEMIDPAIAYGYNPDLKCIHEKHFFTDNMCTFCFKLDDCKGTEND
ncbi:L-2-amino-thiazoline-4-carboxylic acid hydrolase [uncultured Klebsiella sp.]|uniref:L-2-amino-thiazoline-4-carboxylic acid hydrolase n=1 Tax=uncultured Klebsiella sp. TaxID=284011 RepID=UPI002805F87B|nr:L-2-amino-thiazoline-4-carboxylic acid hydrolase [uncultured Klebsiella sp.]